MQANLNLFYLISTSMSRATRVKKLLTTFTLPTYKAIHRPPFGKSDYNYILMIPAYKQKLKQEVPVTRSTGKWSDGADATL
jgi:hypothetical protein